VVGLVKVKVPETEALPTLRVELLREAPYVMPVPLGHVVIVGTV
jgi:hypothetical protein